MDESGVATANLFFLLLSIAMGALVVIGVGLFVYRYLRIKSNGQGLSDTEMLRRAQTAWASDLSNPANAHSLNNPANPASPLNPNNQGQPPSGL